MTRSAISSDEAPVFAFVDEVATPAPAHRDDSPRVPSHTPERVPRHTPESVPSRTPEGGYEGGVPGPDAAEELHPSEVVPTAVRRPGALGRLTDPSAFERTAESEGRTAFAYETGAARLTLHRDVAAACAHAASLGEALEQVVARICFVTGWPVGHAFVRPDDGWPGLVSTDVWHLASQQRYASLRELTQRVFGEPTSAPAEEAAEPDLAVGGGPSLVDRVSARREIVCVESLEECADLPRREPATVAGLRSAIGVPVLAEGEVIAVLEFFRDEPGPLPTAQVDLLDFVAGQLGHLATRERTKEAIRFAAQRSRSLIAQLKDTVSQLRESEARYALVVEAANDGVWDWDRRSDYVYFSPRWKAMVGCAEDEVGNQPTEWLRRVHPEDQERLDIELKQLLESDDIRLECEHRVLHRDGKYRWMLARGLAVRDPSGQAYRVSGSLTDITDRKRIEERVLHDILYDPRTGFPTYPVLLDRLEQAIQRKSRHPDQSSALLSVRLRGIDEAVAEHGLEALDAILVTLARRFTAAVRPGDTVAQVEDDEYAVILEQIGDLESARRTAGRIQANLSLPFQIGKSKADLEPHIGIAVCLPAHDGAEGLLRDARSAMHRALASDSQIQVTDPEAPDYRDSLLYLEADLGRAVERNELVLEYLPTVALHDGRLTCLEALVRWEHPEHGLIPPGRFIPLAEESNLVNEVGYWVIERACRQLKEWRDRFSTSRSVTVAVNLSHRQLCDPDLLERVRASLQATALHGKWLRVDVTESALGRDPQIAQAVLTALHELGIRVAIDDFGTGVSSLSYLHRFPIDALKIDRAFVSGGQGKNEQWEIARTIVELARMLSIDVIAEGIETREQFTRLRSLGCQEAQGFLFSGPVDAEKAARLIHDGYLMDLAAPRR